MLRTIIIIFIVLTSLFSDEYQEQKSNDYTLGEGLKVDSLPLYIGGYFSVDYRNKETENRYRIDDIAILAYGNYNKFSYMVELEFKEFYTLIKSGGSKTTHKNTSLHAERLYLDYISSENYMLRGGKYNSPIGFWNLLPINVLRDTTSNPKSTEMLFPKFTTGALLRYTSYGENDLQVDFILQHNNDLDPNYNNYEINEHYAFGVTYTSNELSVKLNAGTFDNFSNNVSQQLYYALASVQYEIENYKITSELGSQRSKNEFITKYAGYIQGVYRFTPKHAAILRLESYSNNGIKNNMSIFGYTYRPLYPVAIKTEYKIDSLNAEEQFLFSLSVLF